MTVQTPSQWYCWTVCHFKTISEYDYSLKEDLSRKLGVSLPVSPLSALLLDHLLSRTLPTWRAVSGDLNSNHVASLSKCQCWMTSHFKTISWGYSPLMSLLSSLSKVQLLKLLNYSYDQLLTIQLQFWQVSFLVALNFTFHIHSL